MPESEINLPGFSGAIEFEEPGMNVESFDQTARQKTIKVANHRGNPRGRRDYAKGHDITITGDTIGDPVEIGSLGAAIAANNAVTGLGGFTTGAYYIDSMKVTSGQDQMRKITIEASSEEEMP